MGIGKGGPQNTTARQEQDGGQNRVDAPLPHDHGSQLPAGHAQALHHGQLPATGLHRGGHHIHIVHKTHQHHQDAHAVTHQGYGPLILGIVCLGLGDADILHETRGHGHNLLNGLIQSHQLALLGVDADIPDICIRIDPIHTGLADQYPRHIIVTGRRNCQGNVPAHHPANGKGLDLSVPAADGQSLTHHAGKILRRVDIFSAAVVNQQCIPSGKGIQIHRLLRSLIILLQGRKLQGHRFCALKLARAGLICLHFFFHSGRVVFAHPPGKLLGIGPKDRWVTLHIQRGHPGDLHFFDAVQLGDSLHSTLIEVRCKIGISIFLQVSFPEGKNSDVIAICIILRHVQVEHAVYRQNEHRPQGEGGKDPEGLLFLPEHVVQGHGAQPGPPPRFPTASSRQPGVGQGLHGGDFSRQPSRFPAAQSHRQRHKQNGTQKDDRVKDHRPGHGGHIVVGQCLQSPRYHLQAEQHRRQHTGYQTDQGCQYGFCPHQGAQLPGCGSQGLQHAVKPDVMLNGEGQNVADKQTAAHQNEQSSKSQQAKDLL